MYSQPFSDPTILQRTFVAFASEPSPARSHNGVTMSPLIERIERALPRNHLRLGTSRLLERQNLGDYYIIDTHRNLIIAIQTGAKAVGPELSVVGARRRVVR